MKQTEILIVDDLRDVLLTIQGLVSELGYRCDVASSKYEAIDMLGKQDYKLAILDIRLDETNAFDLSGIDIVNWLVATQSHTKAIMLTGYATVSLVTKTLSSGVVIDFCEKADIEGFIESVTKAMKSM